MKTFLVPHCCSQASSALVPIAPTLGLISIEMIFRLSCNILWSEIKFSVDLGLGKIFSHLYQAWHKVSSREIKTSLLWNLISIKTLSYQQHSNTMRELCLDKTPNFEHAYPIIPPPSFEQPTQSVIKMITNVEKFFNIPIRIVKLMP